jgi:hypothetical protein
MLVAKTHSRVVEEEPELEGTFAEVA